MAIEGSSTDQPEASDPAGNSTPTGPRPLASLKVPLIAVGGVALFIAALLWFYSSSVAERSAEREAVDASTPATAQVDYAAKVEEIARARQRPPVPQGVRSAVGGAAGAFESARRKPGAPVDPLPDVDLGLGESAGAGSPEAPETSE